MALKLTIEPLRKGTIAREKLKAEIDAAKANPASKPTFFVCCDCLRRTPITEVGRRYNAAGQVSCKACWTVNKSKIDDTYRAPNQAKIGSIRRASRKAAEKKYKSGKLPKWMFS